MIPISFRAAVVDFELRGDGRTLSGVAMPYNRPTEIVEGGGQFSEQFAAGAFARSIVQRAGKIPLMAAHDSRRWPLGPVRKLTETAAGLEIEARISQTVAGDEVLELVRDGALTGLSVGFRPIRDTWNRNRTERVVNEASLHEVSIVGAPAYDDARILAVRHAPAVPTTSELRAALDALLKKGNR